MKLKNMINKDVPEIMKKLLYGLDYRSSYVVEFLHDMSVDVKEVDIVRDKKTGKIICYKEKEWGEFMKKPRVNMIKEFKQNTKDVFMMIKNNSNSLYIRYLGYILIVLLFPLLFLLDFIDWLIRYIRGDFK